VRRRLSERRGFYAFVGWVLILVGLVLCAFAACPANAAFAQDQETARFWTLLNNYRVANRLAALAPDSRLEAAAEWMANDMLATCVMVGGVCEHTDSSGRPLGPRLDWPTRNPRLDAFGYGGGGAGENIAWGTVGAIGTADQAFAAWKASASHNANMLNGSWKAMGVARRCNAEWCAWTNDFGAEFPSTAPTLTPTPVVPEPGTSTLFVSGLSVLIWRLRCSRP
jgi:uncharacterized protein YkwD